MDSSPLGQEEGVDQNIGFSQDKTADPGGSCIGTEVRKHKDEVGSLFATIFFLLTEFFFLS
jgi:hypothetical protein